MLELVNEAANEQTMTTNQEQNEEDKKKNTRFL